MTEINAKSEMEFVSLTGLELPLGMPGISPALVTVVPGTALAKNIPAGDTIIPG